MTDPSSEIPRTIWLLWLQGLDEAPSLVRRCIRSWELRNPTWDVQVLDSSKAAELTDLDRLLPVKREITAASMSDLVRLALLSRYGGVWVDATTYCNKPLDTWLPIYSASGFFAFENEKIPDRPISSWFLASAPNHFLVRTWWAEALRYWQNRVTTDDYFWLHHLFVELRKDYSEIDEFLSLGGLPVSKPAHSFMKAGRLFTEFDSVKAEIDWTAPLFKFAHYNLHFEEETGSAFSLLSAALRTLPLSASRKGSNRSANSFGVDIRILEKTLDGLTHRRTADSGASNS